MSVFTPPPPSMLVTAPTARERLGAAGRALAPTPAALEDAVAVLVLLLLTLLGLASSFAGPAWLVVGLAGGLLALVVTHVLLVARMPAVVVLLALAAVYLLLGGPLATRQDLIVGALPSGSTFDGLLGTAVTGWVLLLTSVLPVDSAGPLMALPFLLGLVGASVSYAVARRWDAVAPALLPPLLLLVLSVLLGSAGPAQPAWRGAAFGVVLLAWAAVRHGRRGAPLPSGEGLAARTFSSAALVALAAVGGLFLGPLLPGGHATRTVWRSALTSPVVVGAAASPLAGFRAYTQPDPSGRYAATLFTVSGLPDGIPVRLLTMDSYDGQVWSTGGASGVRFRHVGHEIAAPVAGLPGSPVTVTVTVPTNGYADVWLPTVATVTGLEFGGPRAADLADALRFDPVTSAGVLPAGLAPGDTYRLQALVTAPPALSALPARLALATGAGVDPSLARLLDPRITAWSAGSTDPWTTLRTAAREMHTTGAYSDGGPPGGSESEYLPGHGLSRMARFFGSPQMVGDDEQYAAALALVGSRLGVPSRVVLGALPEAGVVKGRDIHAWVEVQTAAGPWLPILPQDVVPDRGRDPAPQQQRATPAPVVAPTPSVPPVPAPTSIVPPAVAAPAAVGSSSERPFLATVLIVGGWALGALLLLTALALAAAVLATILRRRRRRTSGSPAVRVAAAWAEIVDTAAGLGIVVPRGLTRREQAEVLERAAGPGSAEHALPQLAATTDALLFAAQAPQDADAEVAWVRASGVRSWLRGRASFWQRRSADLDLARWRGLWTGSPLAEPSGPPASRSSGPPPSRSSGPPPSPPAPARSGARP